MLLKCQRYRAHLKVYRTAQMLSEFSNKGDKFKLLTDSAGLKGAVCEFGLIQDF